MKKIRVGVAGYGTIGQRLADGVALQGDMELVGIADLAPTLSLKALRERDMIGENGVKYNLYLVDGADKAAFDAADIPVAGTFAELCQKVDIMLGNQDTLRLEMTYMKTDSTGILVSQTDTLEVLSKEPYEKRLKKRQKQYDEWKKKAEKAEKRGNKVEPLQLEEDKPLAIDVKVPADMDPEKNILITSPVPLDSINTAAIHLYSKHDTLWYDAPMQFRAVPHVARTYEILGEWRPEGEYSLEIDSAAFVSIYGRVSDKVKKGIKMKSLDEYSTLLFNVTGMADSTLVVQIIDKQDKPVKQLTTTNGVAEFFYVKPDTYYLRAFIDYNGNGHWDTGCYDEDLQPEPVYYFHEPIECKAKWDVSRTWNPKSVNLAKQKPAEIVKQKADKQKTIKRQNYQRAKKLGIELPDELKKLDEQLQAK